MPREGSKSGKGSKSSKTARVLSLLTDPDAQTEDKSAHAAEDAHTDASAGQRAKDAATEATIRDALASELAGMIPPPPAPEPAPEPEPIPEPEPAPPPPPEPEPVPQPEPEPEPEPELEPAPEPEPEPKPVPEPEPVPAPAPQPVPAPQPQSAPPLEIRTSAAPSQPDPDAYMVLNVTQALVEEKADKYIKMFGLCSCQRCRIDVIALALSSLPAKYVVVHGRDINPRLSFYESKYSAAVITQVMSACKKVLEKPHHER